MNELFKFQLSEYACVKVLLVGLLLFIGLAAVRYIWRSVFSKNRYWRISLRMAPAMEAMLWLVYVEWSVRSCIADPLYYRLTIGVIAAVIVSWISWFAAKDWIAGLIFKSQNVYEAGNQIRLDEIRGSIRRLGYLSLELETDSGEQIKIPYGRILGKVHGSSNTEDASNYHHFEVSIDKEQTASATTKRLRTAVLSSPWSSSQKEPQIRLIKETDERYLFETIVYSAGAECSRAIEEDVKKSLAHDAGPTD